MNDDDMMWVVESFMKDDMMNSEIGYELLNLKYVNLVLLMKQKMFVLFQ